nr:hypothetical protein [Tanacetum cinerariifolium]
EVQHRRMLGRYGLGYIVVDGVICFFKFKNAEGMTYVSEPSPWMVSGKPQIVQKCDPKVGEANYDGSNVNLCVIIEQRGLGHAIWHVFPEDEIPNRTKQDDGNEAWAAGGSQGFVTKQLTVLLQIFTQSIGGHES